MADNPLADVTRAAFVVGAATRPRGTAKVMLFIGLPLVVLGLITALAGSLLGVFALLWGLIFCVLALVARGIGWMAGVGLETAQDVIHDRYDRHQERGDWKFDPYTGGALQPKFDPYTGQPLAETRQLRETTFVPVVQDPPEPLDLRLWLGIPFLFCVVVVVLILVLGK